MEMVLPSKTPVSMRTVPTEGEVCWGGSLYVISGPMEGRKLLRIEDEKMRSLRESSFRHRVRERLGHRRGSSA
jgi:hypothetical protein